MIVQDDGRFEYATLSDKALSRDEPPTVLQLSQQPVTADESVRFVLRLECEETSVGMYLDDELLRDLRETINAALGDRG
jgi:plasmid replication initiation protein